MMNQIQGNGTITMETERLEPGDCLPANVRFFFDNGETEEMDDALCDGEGRIVARIIAKPLPATNPPGIFRDAYFYGP